MCCVGRDTCVGKVGFYLAQRRNTARRVVEQRLKRCRVVSMQVAHGTVRLRVARARRLPRERCRPRVLRKERARRRRRRPYLHQRACQLAALGPHGSPDSRHGVRGGWRGEAADACPRGAALGGHRAAVGQRDGATEAAGVHVGHVERGVARGRHRTRSAAATGAVEDRVSQREWHRGFDRRAARRGVAPDSKADGNQGLSARRSVDERRPGLIEETHRGQRRRRLRQAEVHATHTSHNRHIDVRAARASAAVDAHRPSPGPYGHVLHGGALRAARVDADRLRVAPSNAHVERCDDLPRRRQGACLRTRGPPEPARARRGTLGSCCGFR